MILIKTCQGLAGSPSVFVHAVIAKTDLEEPGAGESRDRETKFNERFASSSRRYKR